jgi:hypothetical protein
LVNRSKGEVVMRLPSIGDCLPIELAREFTLEGSTERDLLLQNTIKINAVEREGVGRFNGLPLRTDWVGRKGYLTLNLPLASAVGFCLSGYRRLTRGFVDCVYCVGEACCIVSFFSRWECPSLLLHNQYKNQKFMLVSLCIGKA